MPTLSPFYIPDISFWQYRYKTDGTIEQPVDFDRMRMKSPGVILRAGQGLVKDKVFDLSWKKAGEVGMVRGSYWFYDPRIEPKRQAEAWKDATEDLPVEMEFWADFERLLVGGKEAHGFDNPHQWYDFMEYSKQLMPQRKFGVYTGYYYWQERFFGNPIPVYWKQYPLWIAAYGPSALIPKPWTDYLYWQFTDNGPGPEYGVASGNIDLNSFNGTEEQFTARYPAVQKGIPMTTRFRMSAKQDGTRARSSTDGLSKTNIVSTPPHYVKGTIFGGDMMVTTPQGIWMYVTEINGKPATPCYVARTYNNVTVCDNFVERKEDQEQNPDSGWKVEVKGDQTGVKEVIVNGTPWKK
jgi:GH25 family lysozyme M1 (1,4-beta-N-acetylmuramidase)